MNGRSFKMVKFLLFYTPKSFEKEERAPRSLTPHSQESWHSNQSLCFISNPECAEAEPKQPKHVTVLMLAHTPHRFSVADISNK